MKEGAAATGENWRDNYITPPRILEAVNTLWPRGWFDPCPSKRSCWYDGDSVYDGLVNSWPIESYVNPPFSQYLKWLAHGLPQMVDQLWICHHDSSTERFKRLWNASDAFVLLEDRVKFIDPRTGEPTTNSSYGKSQTIFYIGSDIYQFNHVFKNLGYVARTDVCYYDE